MQTPWEKTILESLLKFEGEYNVTTKDGIVYIERQDERKEGKDYTYLLNGINDIAKNLAKIWSQMIDNVKKYLIIYWS